MPGILLSALVIAAALAVSVGGGYLLTVLVLRLADRESGTAANSARVQEQAGPGTRVDPAQVLRGGTWIGILERVAITVAVLASYPAAIAVVVAVKGLGRFPELRAAGGVSERFIIGTLCSGLWAALVGLGANALVNAIG